MLAPWSRSARSNGPKKPESVCTPGRVKSSVPTASSAVADAQVLPVVALAERPHERGRLAGPERHGQRVPRAHARGGLLGGQLLHPAQRLNRRGP